MEKAIEFFNQYVGVVDMPMRKAVGKFLEKKWHEALELFHTNNDTDEANILASFGLLYSAAQLEDERAEEYANRLLGFTNFQFWPYLKEHSFPRYARRFALHYLAYANNEKNNFWEALGLIEEALSIDSPIDDLDNSPLLETKAQICLNNNQLKAAYTTIHKLKRIDPENTSFEEITKSDSYQKYFEEKI